MNFTAKSNSSPQRLPVQWLASPAVGPLPIFRRSAAGVGRVAGPRNAVQLSCCSDSRGVLKSQTRGRSLTDSERFGSATVPVAVAGVSPANPTIITTSPIGEATRVGDVFEVRTTQERPALRAETPKTAAETTALPKATESFRPRATLFRNRITLPRRRAFTLLELMMVIAIIGFIAAVALPRVAGLGQANSMVTATRQVLDDVALARQRAMVNRSTVYMVFLPPEFWNSPSFSQIPYTSQITNLMMHQYSAYALISLATVGDQPGQHHPQYVTDWRILPSGVFIAPWQFTLTNNAVTNLTTTNTLADTRVFNSIYPWTWVNVPFPSLYSTNSYGSTYMYLPAIAFTPQGTVAASGVRQYEYIALARGSIFYPTDTNGVPLFDPPNLTEVPPANDIHNPNLIQIDLLTARATLIQNQFQ